MIRTLNTLGWLIFACVLNENKFSMPMLIRTARSWLRSAYVLIIDADADTYGAEQVGTLRR
jgi:hypothetical protein